MSGKNYLYFSAEDFTSETIDDKWHLYTQSVAKKGPIPTSFVFESNPNYLKKGNTVEEESQTIDDPIFEMRIKYFESAITFEQ